MADEAASSSKPEEAGKSSKPEEAQKTNQPFDKYESFADYQNTLLRTIMEVTATASRLPPPGQEYDYYNSFALFKRVMATEGQTILGMLSSLAQQQTGKVNMFQMEGTDFDEKIELLTEVNDILLERAGISLDIAKGIKREQSGIELATVSKQIDTIWNRKNDKLRRDTATSVSLLTAKNVARPQLAFPDKIDNSNSPFVPVIKEKPHAKKPLAILLEKQENGREIFSHPYEIEIETFQPTEEQMTPNVRDPLPLADTPLLMVDTPKQIDLMMDHLRTQKCIALDLEHHSFRSFQGFTCLIQISTWEKDFIIDALVLRAHLHVLNEVTTDPSIVKVLHGALSDVQWLQRDFGVYLVNLFDTGAAAKLLGFERLSLSFLLKHYMSVEADKRFQLVDWRIRPLPEEMIAYARGDTHYLLPIFERMKKDLADASNAQGNLIRVAWERSSQICTRRYEKPLLEEDSHLQLMKAYHKRMNEKQLYALKHIYLWRDRLARELDESTGYILPNHMLLHICEILPREIQGILACCNPCPPLVKQQLNELHQIILKAREVQLSNPLLSAPKLEIPVPSISRTLDMDNILYVVHDLGHTHAQDDTHVRLPTLIDENGQLVSENESRLNSENDSSNVAPRLRYSSLFPRQKGGDSLIKPRLPTQLYVQAGPEGQNQTLRMITPYERYVKEIERAEREQESLSRMLEQAKHDAQMNRPNEESPVAEQNATNDEEVNKAGDKEDEEAPAVEEEEPEPTIIRGVSSRKRKREGPSIPLTGGDETSYKNTQSSKLEKRQKKREAQQDKQRQKTQPFDYATAIQEQAQQQQQQSKRQDGPSRGRGRGRGQGGQQSKRKQFDDMEELREAESDRSRRGRGGAQRSRGAKRRGGSKFRGGNRSMIVSGGSQRSGSSSQWPSR